MRGEAGRFSIDPIKKRKIKKALLEGHSARSALRIAGYRESYVSHSTATACVKVSMDEILKEFRASELRPEDIIKNLEEIKRLALIDHDYSTATRCEELKGKWLAMFVDRSINTTEIDIKTRALLVKYSTSRIVDNSKDRLV